MIILIVAFAFDSGPIVVGKTQSSFKVVLEAVLMSADRQYIDLLKQKIDLDIEENEKNFLFLSFY